MHGLLPRDALLYINTLDSSVRGRWNVFTPKLVEANCLDMWQFADIEAVGLSSRPASFVGSLDLTSTVDELILRFENNMSKRARCKYTLRLVTSNKRRNKTPTGDKHTNTAAQLSLCILGFPPVQIVSTRFFFLLLLLLCATCQSSCPHLGVILGTHAD